MFQALHDRAASKLNGQCDCDKKSRAMEEQVTNLKGQLTELYSQYSQLAEEHKAFAAKLDQAAQVVSDDVLWIRSNQLIRH